MNTQRDILRLVDHIREVREGIRTGRFVNEASVSQGIVLRILQALEWPTYDTQIVCPEHTLEGRRVDYALCHPRNKPIAFVEVKQVGQSEGAERQLFEYAFHVGIPMAILTDGQEWHFFLPGEQGLYQDRRVYKLDIIERDLEESVDRFKRYLSYERMCSGQAIEAARQDYRNVSKERQLTETIPVAWTKLLEEQDELLIELIADKVESLCGYKPEPDMVSVFLESRVNSSKRPPRESPKKVYPAKQASLPTRKRQSSSPARSTISNEQPSYMLNGVEHQARNAKDAMILVFEQLSTIDSSFLPRFAALPKHGRKRRYVAQSKEDLYPGRPDLAIECSHQLTTGYWIGTNYSKRTIDKIIQIACEVAGLKYGKDLMVRL